MMCRRLSFECGACGGGWWWCNLFGSLPLWSSTYTSIRSVSSSISTPPKRIRPEFLAGSRRVRTPTVKRSWDEILQTIGVQTHGIFFRVRKKDLQSGKRLRLIHEERRKSERAFTHLSIPVALLLIQARSNLLGITSPQPKLYQYW